MNKTTGRNRIEAARYVSQMKDKPPLVFLASKFQKACVSEANKTKSRAVKLMDAKYRFTSCRHLMQIKSFESSFFEDGLGFQVSFVRWKQDILVELSWRAPGTHA